MRLELTRRGDYGVRAMVALASVAATDSQHRVSVRRIAETMGVPPLILPSVMSRLVLAHLVVAQEGRAGGYRLARDARHIGILEIIEAVEGDTRRRRCVLRGSACGGGAVCSIHDVFVRAEEHLREDLARAVLADVRPTMAAAKE